MVAEGECKEKIGERSDDVHEINRKMLREMCVFVVFYFYNRVSVVWSIFAIAKFISVAEVRLFFLNVYQNSK